MSDIIGWSLGIIIFWGGIYVYHFFSDKYWKKKQAEWDEELRKELGTIQFDEIKQNFKRGGL